MKRPAINLDDLLTVEEFAAWSKTPVATVRKRLPSLPGVVRESRKCVRIHPRTYLEKRLKSKLS
jgi:hypothetical protein